MIGYLLPELSTGIETERDLRRTVDVFSYEPACPPSRGWDIYITLNTAMNDIPVNQFFCEKSYFSVFRLKAKSDKNTRS